jgi:formate/nitrite transporter FocA (FNT family)
MTLFSLRTITYNANDVALSAMGINLVATTLGNIAGGLLFAFAYWAIGRKPV